MRYMLLFWVDEAAESTADEDAAMLIAVKSWVEKLTEQGVRLTGGPGVAAVAAGHQGGARGARGPARAFARGLRRAVKQSAGDRTGPA